MAVLRELFRILILLHPKSKPEMNKHMKKIIVITGASSGFGALTARALAKAGHTVYASIRETKGRNAPQVEEAKKFAKDNNVDLRTIELDVAYANERQSVRPTRRRGQAGHATFNPRIENPLCKDQQIPVQGSLTRTVRSVRGDREFAKLG